MPYDLHLHSCLSPCANDDMTPATIAGLAKLSGADLIAITDHNSALNLPAAEIACKAYGLRLLPGIEVNTAEEIHVLCYFKTVADALSFGAQLYHALPDFPYDPAVWGNQLIVDENDTLLGSVEKLLTGAVRLDIYAVKAACEALGGVAVPAHVERDSYSVLSVLGFLSEDLPFTAIEARQVALLPPLLESGRLPLGLCVLSSSDAHRIEDIACNLQEFPPDCPLQALL